MNTYEKRGEGASDRAPVLAALSVRQVYLAVFFELVRNYELGARTTVMDLSILAQRAGLFSCGATSRNGP